MRVDGVKQLVPFYNLDVIISVGYRVKSKRGIAFRKWANAVLKDYIIKGYAVNNNRMNQLNEVIQVMKRVENTLDAKQILSVIEKYSLALDMLDDYDHQAMKKPAGTSSTYILSYDECKVLIDSMKYGDNSTVFGNEKDESFKGSIGAIYQTFAGEELYPSLQEKAAMIDCNEDILKYKIHLFYFKGIGNYSGTIEKTFTIAKKQLTVSSTTVSNKTYDGGTTGTVTITATVDGDNNYNGDSATYDLTVDPKALSVVIDNQEIVRGMNIPTFTSTVTGNVEGDAIIVAYNTITDNMTAGDYTITMTNTSDYVNYDITVTSGILTITEGYTVSFDDMEVTDIAYGTTVSQPTDPTKDGYVFMGWYLGNSEFDFTTAITGDLALTSVWEEVETTGSANVIIDVEGETDVEDEKDTTTTVPYTGDHGSPKMLMIVMLASLLGILVVRKKKLVK